MDEYGYGAAASCGLKMFETCSRGSGRTQRMIERLADGDCVIVATAQFGEYIRGRLRDAGKNKVKVVVADPRRDPFETLAGTIFGQVLFDHTWVLAYHEMMLNDATTSFDRLREALAAASRMQEPLKHVDPSARPLHNR